MKSASARGLCGWHSSCSLRIYDSGGPSYTYRVLVRPRSAGMLVVVVDGSNKLTLLPSSLPHRAEPAAYSSCPLPVFRRTLLPSKSRSRAPHPNLTNSDIHVAASVSCLHPEVRPRCTYRLYSTHRRRTLLLLPIALLDRSPAVAFSCAHPSIHPSTLGPFHTHARARTHTYARHLFSSRGRSPTRSHTLLVLSIPPGPRIPGLAQVRAASIELHKNSHSHICLPAAASPYFSTGKAGYVSTPIRPRCPTLPCMLLMRLHLRLASVGTATLQGLPP